MSDGRLSDDDGQLNSLDADELSHITLSFTESFRGISMPRKLWIMDRASNYEWCLVRLAEAVSGTDVGAPVDQRRYSHVEIAETEEVRAGVTVDVSDVEAGDVSLLMNVVECLEAALRGDIESAWRKSGAVTVGE